MDAFGYEQLLFEPIVGGGLFTAASLPLIAEFGPIPVLIGVSGIGVKSTSPENDDGDSD